MLDRQRLINVCPRPVPDEGVLNVAVRVIGWCGPTSLHSQKKIRWNLWNEIPESFISTFKEVTPLENNYCSYADIQNVCQHLARKNMEHF